MDEFGLQALMARAVADRPPVPHLVARAVRQGQRIRWRRRIQGTAALAAALALVTAAPLALAALTAHRPPAANGTGRPTAFVLVSSPRGTTAVVPITVASGRRGKPIEIQGDNVRFTASVALSPDGRTLYVLTTAGVTPVDVATRRAGRPIRLDCGKHCDGTGMLLAPDGATAYVEAQEGTPTPGAPRLILGVVPVSLRTRTAGRLIRVADPGAMAITPDGRTLYVQRDSISKTIEVTPIRTATDTALRPITIRFPGFTVPGGIVMAPVGHALYLCNVWYPNSSQSGEMFVRVNTATNTASAPIEPKNFFGWCAAAFSADGKTMFMGGRTDVLPMDTATGALLAPIRMPSWMQVYGLTMSPDGRVLYAIFPYNPGPGIQPVDTATGALLRPIRLWVPRHFLPTPLIAIGPDGTAYAARFRSYGRTGQSELGQVVPVNLATGRIGKTISLGDAQADQVVFAP
jgi:DNA-binding beta-propeller fold protein YncE